MMGTPTPPLRALYYPLARTVNETTLKRAVLLYDEILFVDPMSSRARAGLFSVENHNSHLLANPATALAAAWKQVSQRYEVLERAGLLRLVDPASAVEQPASGELIATALRADPGGRATLRRRLAAESTALGGPGSVAALPMPVRRW